MANNKVNKGTRAFNKTIKAYLEEKAETDALFAVKFANPSKSVDECVTYILNSVQKSGCCGFTDDEVFGMAIHYYEENEIEVGKPLTNCQVVVNHSV
ncbi:PcfK-like family protein, partial [Muribaculum intestinale]|uniref:PcfK-like family protein n=1 Tax=Muribaculum intestinale TaxID=1796646 RepID=UPI0025A1904D